MSQGFKDDGGKAEHDLFPIDAYRAILRVLMYGAYERPRKDGSKGYGARNWEKVEGARRRYYNALRRHVDAWYYDGEVTDPESGFHHLAHAGCCLIFLLSLDLRSAFIDEIS